MGAQRSPRPRAPKPSRCCKALLIHDTNAEIERNVTDTHGASIVGFAFCELLGFRLMARFKQIGAMRLYARTRQRPEVGDRAGDLRTQGQLAAARPALRRARQARHRAQARHRRSSLTRCSLILRPRAPQPEPDGRLRRNATVTIIPSWTAESNRAVGNAFHLSASRDGPKPLGNRDRQEGARTSTTRNRGRSARLQRSPRPSPLGTPRNTCKCEVGRVPRPRGRGRRQMQTVGSRAFTLGGQDRNTLRRVPDKRPARATTSPDRRS